MVNKSDAIRVLLLALMAVSAAQAAAKDAGAKPNILWIIAEDMSPDLGCYGNEAVTTPNIDGLAKRGMLFMNVHTTGPACSPSRTALATGVFQTTLGAHHMRYSVAQRPALPPPIKILPQLMRENGYITGNIREICGTGRGKDDWQFQTDQKKWDTDAWEELIRHQPFYAQINMQESHRLFDNASEGVNAEKIRIPPYYPDHPVSRSDWAGYLGEVTTADRHVGAILKQLEADGLAHNTIVIFMSDHGRPMIRGKNWLYDSGTHIPLVITYPDDMALPAKFRPGTVNEELISAIDLVAETLLMAGAAVPDWMQGRSFLREDSQPRTHLYSAVDRIGNIATRSRAVRTHHFKYIRNFKTPGSINACTTYYRRTTHPIYHLLNIMGERNLLTPMQTQLLQPLAEEELYDLRRDPYETVNLIGDPKFVQRHQALKADLAQWLTESKDQGLGEDSPELVKHFHDYGMKTNAKQKNGLAKTRAAVAEHFKN